jgi:hypothetical protein
MTAIITRLKKIEAALAGHIPTALFVIVEPSESHQEAIARHGGFADSVGYCLFIDTNRHENLELEIAHEIQRLKQLGLSASEIAALAGDPA